MLTSVETVGDVAIVAANVDQLDIGNSADFKEACSVILEQHPKLVLDMHRVQFIDSSGCGALLATLKHAIALKGDLKICAVTKPVHTVLDMIRMHRICDIVDTREAAVEAFAKGQPAGNS
ncbi:MAG TPA: STAS domain-containing protein [Planctomycetaceae bacterium]|nr:STAS domain-containing protein [Planctomycetaceae bacterium]